MVLTMTAGTAVIMWLGELITDRGIGNGMSLLIFTSIIAPLPRSSSGRSSRPTARFTFVAVIAMGVALVVAGGLRRAGPAADPGAVRQADGRPAACTAARRPTSRIKVNQAGVIPVIFASSLLYIPTLLVNLFGDPDRRAGQPWIQTNFVRGRPPALHRCTFFAADHLLHVLLRRDHVQPGRGRRQHEEVRRLHPGHPGRPADRRVPRLRADPAHRRRARSTWRSSRSCRSSRSRFSASAASSRSAARAS